MKYLLPFKGFINVGFSRYNEVHGTFFSMRRLLIPLILLTPSLLWDSLLMKSGLNFVKELGKRLKDMAFCEEVLSLRRQELLSKLKMEYDIIFAKFRLDS